MEIYLFEGNGNTASIVRERPNEMYHLLCRDLQKKILKQGTYKTFQGAKIALSRMQTCNPASDKSFEVTRNKAKEFYCGGNRIYISYDDKAFQLIPPSWYYGSHASAEELFYRGIPYGAKNVRFFLL